MRHATRWSRPFRLSAYSVDLRLRYCARLALDIALVCWVPHSPVPYLSPCKTLAKAQESKGSLGSKNKITLSMDERILF